ncbi:unnamed protein product [Coregonus sp. 'balchen']|nr:unnamed protein product [Coregonus sp. 'balchen']
MDPYADLMPVYSYGENNIFRQVTFSEGSVGWRLQQLLKKIMGFAPCLFVGEHWFWIPYHCPVTTFESPSGLPSDHHIPVATATALDPFSHCLVLWKGVIQLIQTDWTGVI